MARNYGERFGGMRNFLATDEVPKTLFGVPIVADPDEYTDADLAFFRKNPEAGGYYDLGSEDPWDATPDDGTAEGAPVQDSGGGVVGALRRRAGAAGEVADAGIAWLERQAKKTADMNVPVLSTAAKILQPAYVGARAAIAKVASGGGKYYQPEVRDERHFSKDALREMAGNLARHNGRNMTRFGYTGLGGGTGAIGNAAAWEASQSVGGASVRSGKVIDKFDVDSKDPYGISDDAHFANEALGRIVDAGHRALGAVFGDENDPDAGKVRTEIPVEAIEAASKSAVRGGK